MYGNISSLLLSISMCKCSPFFIYSVSFYMQIYSSQLTIFFSIINCEKYFVNIFIIFHTFPTPTELIIFSCFVLRNASHYHFQGYCRILQITPIYKQTTSVFVSNVGGIQFGEISSPPIYLPSDLYFLKICCMFFNTSCCVFHQIP